MAKWVYFGTLVFNSIRWIQLYDKKNLTFVDCCDKILLNSSWKTLLSSPKAHLITFFKDSFNKTLSKQLTQVRSYICAPSRVLRKDNSDKSIQTKSMGECNTTLSAYTKYRHLE